MAQARCPGRVLKSVSQSVMQRSLKAMLLRTTNLGLPDCYCHLPTMVSAGRWVVTPGGHVDTTVASLKFGNAQALAWINFVTVILFSNITLKDIGSDLLVTSTIQP